MRGLRAVSDFETEMQMAQMNNHLSGVETIFIPTSSKYSFVASKLVREVARFGGDVSAFVPEVVAEHLQAKYDDGARRGVRSDERSVPRRGRGEPIDEVGVESILDQVLDVMAGPSRCRSPRRSWCRARRSPRSSAPHSSALPDELRQARWLLREREEFMAERSREAEALMDEVRAQAEHMVQRTEIVRQANSVAQRILDDANEEARAMRHEAEDFVDTKLAGMEIVLDRLTRTVQAGRAKLAGPRAWAPSQEDEAVGDGGGRLLRSGSVLMATRPVRRPRGAPAPQPRRGPRTRCAGARWPWPARSTRRGSIPGRSVVPPAAEAEGDVDAASPSRAGSRPRAPYAPRGSGICRRCAEPVTGELRDRGAGAIRDVRRRRRGPLPDHRRHHRPGAPGPRRHRARAAHGAPVPGGLPRPVPAVRGQPQRGRLRLRCPPGSPVG